MGMANSDDEAKIMEDRELLEWARERPTDNRNWDSPHETEDQRAYREADEREWLNKRPKTRNPYDNERR